MMDLKFFVLFLFWANVQGQFYEDRRCRCICPRPSAIVNTSKIDRQVFTGNVPANKCSCEFVILPIIGAEIAGKESIFCPRCDCVFQTRNTTIIMITVFVILWTLSLLIGFMGFLELLKPWIEKAKEGFRRLRNRNVAIEEDEEDISERSSSADEYPEIFEQDSEHLRRSLSTFSDRSRGSNPDWIDFLDYITGRSNICPLRIRESPTFDLDARDRNLGTSRNLATPTRQNDIQDATLINTPPSFYGRGGNSTMVLRPIPRVNYKLFF